MDKTLIEVFVEEHCPACREVLSKLCGLASDGLFTLVIFNRSTHAALFEERNVNICPATFVNRRPAFYGEFTLGDLRQYVFRHQQITDD